MGYRKIPNLYKNQEILAFRKCYATEKVHGTSAHVSYDGETKEIRYFSGESKPAFEAFFDKPKLKELFEALELETANITVYGECYGGKVQGMSSTYGKEVRFIVFEVRINEYWQNVDRAKYWADRLELEFVPYKIIPATIKRFDAERAKFSEVAERRGCGTDKKREGIVLRPLIEYQHQNGGRLLAKYKNEIFSERKSKRDTKSDPKLQLLKSNAKEAAEEWVTPMRLLHVLDKISGEVKDMTRTREVIGEMLEDVIAESQNELAVSDQLRCAISARTGKILKQYLQDKLEKTF